MKLPRNGRSKETVLDRLRKFKARDATWQDGRMFGLIYEAGGEVENLVKAAASEFMIENALSPMAFPSLLQLENEVTAIVLDLMRAGNEGAASLTSGGTESILMALKAARDWAREHRPRIRRPEMVVPVTAHPAWNKAAHYLGLEIRMTPVDDDFRADVAAIREAVSENTIIVGASAVTYPHGMIDPIEEIGRLAEAHHLWLHVDACLGGLMLPFLRKLGNSLPAYDFTVPGVRSISADLHKYAYTPKGISTVLYRNRELRKYQYFVYADWPGGIYATPSLAGARSGGTLAAAWAVMQYLGEEGFLRMAQRAGRATNRLIDGIQKIEGLHVLGRPDATVFAFGSQSVHIYELGARLKAQGWHVEAQHLPASLHMTVSPVHDGIVDRFLQDLKRMMVDIPPADAEAENEEAAIYGMIGTMADRHQAKEFALNYLNDLYRLPR
jgi:glutamate/tyrosine decarboxylase-like PLP-dependent enzyme